MASVNYHIQVVLPDGDGIAQHEVVNTFNITDVSGAGARAAIAAEVVAFYNGANTTWPVAKYLGQSRSRGANNAQIRFYDVTAHLNGSAAGSPVETVTFTLGASFAAPEMAPQTAVVLSYRSDDILTVPEKGAADAAIPSSEAAIDQGAPAVHAGFDKPRARRRGRIYLGTMDSTTAETIAGSLRSHVAVVAQVDIGVAFGRLVDNISELASPGEVSVWSRRDAAFHAVNFITGGTIGFVDSEFDVVRRRGIKGGTRTPSVVPA